MLLYNCILSFARLEERLHSALILVASGLEKLSKEAESVRWSSLLPPLLSLYHLFLPATTSADNMQVQYYLHVTSLLCPIKAEMFSDILIHITNLKIHNIGFQDEETKNWSEKVREKLIPLTPPSLYTLIVNLARDTLTKPAADSQLATRSSFSQG